MKKVAAIAITLLLTVGLIAGCGGNKEDADKNTGAADVVTTASIVNDNEAFLKAISKDGTWIAATLNDLTFNQELVLEGEFTNRDVVARKIALYTQDDDHNITASFKLTAPRLVIKSENTRLQGGTFIGDVYVEANGFVVTNATVEGNVYFASEEYKASFDSSNEGTITGVVEVKAQ